MYLIQYHWLLLQLMVVTLEIQYIPFNLSMPHAILRIYWAWYLHDLHCCFSTIYTIFMMLTTLRRCFQFHNCQFITFPNLSLTSSHSNANAIASKLGKGRHCTGKLEESYEFQGGRISSVNNGFRLFMGCIVYQAAIPSLICSHHNRKFIDQWSNFEYLKQRLWWKNWAYNNTLILIRWSQESILS